MKISKLQCVLLPMVLLFIYLSMSSYSGGISGQYTAGCTCHGNGTPNPNTIVTVTGPTAYAYNQVITYTVTVSNASELAAGFNLKCNIGQITSVGSGVQNFSTTEIGHNTPRSLTGGTATWTFQWTAPSSGSTPLQFNIAGNAVNLSGGPDAGDAWNFGTVPAIPLPVTFRSFKVSVEGAAVKCAWTMADQRDVDHFEIERSTDGLQFDYWATVPKNKDDVPVYAYYDRRLAGSQVYYYRLKEVTNTGHVAYTQVESVSFKENASQVVLYPNVLTGNQFFVKGLDFSHKSYRLQLVSLEGRVVYEAGLQDQVVTLPALATGSYIARIADNHTQVYSGMVFKR